MAGVSVRKVVKAYEGGVQAVRGIDLSKAPPQWVQYLKGIDETFQEP